MVTGGLVDAERPDAAAVQQQVDDPVLVVGLGVERQSLVVQGQVGKQDPCSSSCCRWCPSVVRMSGTRLGVDTRLTVGSDPLTVRLVFLTHEGRM
ncbi:hypothetical protein ACWKWC_05840 [Geodermatophilus nigrescens]